MKRAVVRIAGAYAALLLLTASSIAAALTLSGPAAILIPLGVSIASALVVVLAFMELRHSDTVSRLSAMIAAGLLAVMFALTFADDITRAHIPAGFEGGSQSSAESDR